MNMISNVLVKNILTLEKDFETEDDNLRISG